MTKVDPSLAVAPGSATLRLGGVEINRIAHAVSVDGTPIALTAREYRLLEYLVAYSDKLVTRVELVNQVWGPEYRGGLRTVDIHVSRLRRKLGRALRLVTLRSEGYRLSGNGG